MKKNKENSNTIPKERFEEIYIEKNQSIIFLCRKHNDSSKDFFLGNKSISSFLCIKCERGKL
jgi:hypothetical protein